MADTSSNQNPAAWWPWNAWSAALSRSVPSFAPQQVAQSILPGWSLVTVNNNNSSAPDVETAIVSEHSYGRQLGRLTDAMIVLIGKVPGAESNPAVRDFLDLAAKIKAIKDKAAPHRIERLVHEIEEIRDTQPALLEQLRNVLR